MYNYIHKAIDRILKLITTKFYNLKFHAQQSSRKWVHILKNIISTSKLCRNKIAYDLLLC